MSSLHNFPEGKRDNFQGKVYTQSRILTHAVKWHVVHKPCRNHNHHRYQRTWWPTTSEANSDPELNTRPQPRDNEEHGERGPLTDEHRWTHITFLTSRENRRRTGSPSANPRLIQHCSSKVEKMVLGGRIFQKNSIIFFESNYVIWV